MSSRGRNPSRPSNTGFKVVPAHAPKSAYLGKAKKLKESLIERARIKKSFAKALKKEGLQSERLGRVQGQGRGHEGEGGLASRGSHLRGRGSSRGGARAGGKGGSRSSVIKQDGIRELVQLSRKSNNIKSDPSSTPTTTTATGSAGTKTPTVKRTVVVPESESDESELESGEERAPRPSKSKVQGSNLAPGGYEDEDDDGFFDDDDNVEGDMIDSRVSLRGTKGKGKDRAGGVEEEDTGMSYNDNEDEEMGGTKRSRERSRAGPPPPGDDNDDDDDNRDENDEEVFLPYTNSNPRGRGGSIRGTSTSTSTNSRGRNHPQGRTQGAPSSSTSSSSTPIYGPGRARPWGTDGVASMSGSMGTGTMTRPKGKKDRGNPNFTFLGRMGEDDGDSGNREGRAGGLGGRSRSTREGQGMGADREVPPVVAVDNEPFRGKPLHSHKIPGGTSTSTSTPSDPNSNNPRSTVTATLRDLKRAAYLGPARTTPSSSSSSAGVHPGRTKRTLQRQAQQALAQQQGGRAGAGVTGGRRNDSGRGGGGGRGARQPRLGARMGALLQEIERRG